MRYTGENASTARVFCTTQSSFGRAGPVAMTTSFPQNHVQLPISRSYRTKELMWTFSAEYVIRNNRRKHASRVANSCT